jgi:hypothetical protein
MLSDVNPCGLSSEGERTLRAKLIAAEILSIDMDIDFYRQEIDKAEREARRQDVLLLEQRIDRLRGVLKTMRSMDPARYVLPIKRRIRLRPTIVYGIGSALEYDNLKSGSTVYRAAGIQGDDFSLLEPGRWYSLEVYILRPRDASVSVPEYYVYVMAPSEPAPGFSVPDR